MGITDSLWFLSGSPAEWGYTISPENGHFIPVASSSNGQPFKVHVFGAREEGVHIPPELEEHVLVFHTGLDYIDYYRELSKLVSSIGVIRACVHELFADSRLLR